MALRALIIHASQLPQLVHVVVLDGTVSPTGYAINPTPPFYAAPAQTKRGLRMNVPLTVRSTIRVLRFLSVCNAGSPVGDGVAEFSSYCCGNDSDCDCTTGKNVILLNPNPATFTFLAYP